MEGRERWGLEGGKGERGEGVRGEGVRGEGVRGEREGGEGVGGEREGETEEREREERGREKEEGRFRGCRQATESGEPTQQSSVHIRRSSWCGRLTVPWLVVLTLFQEGKYKIPQRPSTVTLWGKAQALAYDAGLVTSGLLHSATGSAKGGQQEPSPPSFPAQLSGGQLGSTRGKGMKRFHPGFSNSVGMCGGIHTEHISSANIHESM